MSIPVEGVHSDKTGFCTETGYEADSCELAPILTAYGGDKQRDTRL
jgi:hypothetical protein